MNSPRASRSPRSRERLRRMSNAVSSRGCSRIFILKVLIQAYDHVSSLLVSPDFPFDSNLVKSWLVKAKSECGSLSFAEVLGGISFDDDDISSHWTHPRQFFTWWKNNVERRSKFATLMKDAEYVGDNEKLIQRAEFCANVVSLASNIRMHFDRYRITVDGVDVPGEQMPVPCLLSRLPANTTAAMKTSSSMSTFAISEGYAGYESELDEHLLNPLHRISTDQDMSCRRDGIASRCSSNSLSMITAPSTEPYRCQNPPCDMYDMLDLFREIGMSSPTTEETAEMNEQLTTAPPVTTLSTSYPQQLPAIPVMPSNRSIPHPNMCYSASTSSPLLTHVFTPISPPMRLITPNMTIEETDNAFPLTSIAPMNTGKSCVFRNQLICPDIESVSPLVFPSTDDGDEDENPDEFDICPPPQQLTLHKPLVRRAPETSPCIKSPQVFHPPFVLTFRSTNMSSASSTPDNSPPTSARSTVKRRYSFDICSTGDEEGKTSRSGSLNDDGFYFCSSPTDEEYPCTKRSTPQHRNSTRSPAPEMTGVYNKDETPFTFFHPDFELLCIDKEEV